MTQPQNFRNTFINNKKSALYKTCEANTNLKANSYIFYIMNNDGESRFAVTPSFVLTHLSVIYSALHYILMGSATSSYGHFLYSWLAIMFLSPLDMRGGKLILCTPFQLSSLLRLETSAV